MGAPEPTVHWKKNGKRLSENNKKYHILPNNNNNHGASVSYLRVADANQPNLGNINISCLVESYLGENEAVATLNIISEKRRPDQFPHIQISNPKSVEPNKPFKIECNVTCASPTSSLKWYQSNRPISFDNYNYFANWSTVGDRHSHVLYVVKGMSLDDELYHSSQEIDFACSIGNKHGTYLAETSILLKSKFNLLSFKNKTTIKNSKLLFFSLHTHFFHSSRSTPKHIFIIYDCLLYIQPLYQNLSFIISLSLSLSLFIS